jgi:hypothetical protein
VAVVVEENPRGSRRYCWRFGLQWKPVCGERLGKRSGRERQGRLAAMLKKDEGLGFFIGRGAVCFCWRDGWSLERFWERTPRKRAVVFSKGRAADLVSEEEKMSGQVLRFLVSKGEGPTGRLYEMGRR